MCITRDGVAFHAGLKACARGGNGELAIEILEKMEKRDRVAYNK